MGIRGRLRAMEWSRWIMLQASSWIRAVAAPRLVAIHADLALTPRVRSRHLWTCLLVLMTALLPAASAEPVEETAQAIIKQVTGSVVNVNTRTISVEYDQKAGTSYEMLLPLAKKDELHLAHFQTLAELKRGDTVTVTYRETYKMGDDGKPVPLTTLATEVALVKRATEGAFRSTQGGAR